MSAKEWCRSRMNVQTVLFVGVLAGCGASPQPTTAAPVTVQTIAPVTPSDDPDARCVDFTVGAASIALDAPQHVAEAPLHAFRTASGLATCVIAPSTSAQRPARVQDRVTVHYTGWTTDGERFDSSVERDSPSTFRLDGVIAGWTEGLQLMRVGERRRFWIPEDLAYGGRVGRPAGVLVFDVELQAVESLPDPPSVPADVAAPPSTAAATASGLYSQLLETGTGTTHPGPRSRVTVHYTGWTTAGEMFDSSITRGTPATFPLNGVIAGWTEGVQLMVEGETRRFWIPESLAYAGRAGAPQGMLVFDVLLITIEP
ncbi:MAG: FKBP-type peptidyl-prolyl cis-trans isomerase [Polyangiales bacterium]|jgi:FKBP-type peptidyl-prolyl cis-trans isomerase